MKLLVLADHCEPGLWDYYTAGKTEGVDLILSCGDLDPEYLEFLVTVVNKPLLYVRGNHDGVYDAKPPLGCTCIDGSVYDYQGLRIFGLGGSYRYRTGEDMYTERQMRRRIWKASGKLFLSGGFDILLTHAPAYGCGDLQDLPHRGFECFNDLLNQYKPSYMVHGHVHKEYGHFERELIHESGTRIINCYGHVIKEVNPESGTFTRAFPGKLKRL